MNRRVQIVSVPVSDQERAEDFYVNSLGFELRADNSWGENMRWVEVAPKGSDASLTLLTWFDAMPPVRFRGSWLARTTPKRPTKSWPPRRWPFDFPPRELPGGLQAVFRDPDGNGLVLAQW